MDLNKCEITFISGVSFQIHYEHKQVQIWFGPTNRMTENVMLGDYYVQLKPTIWVIHIKSTCRTAWELFGI